MATVYRAQKVLSNGEVALKVVAPHLASDANFSQRFLREARAGVMVRHPHVIACYDVGLFEGQLFLAMELVSGGDLQRLLFTQGGRLDDQRAVSLVRDVCSGLEAIEAAGLVHRDIKPANIFITAGGSAKLADLGLVRFAGDDRMTVPGTIMGTPAYIAPEQARGDGDIDIRADIYSLGATLYHLLTGQPPFASDNPLTTLVRAINEPFPDPRVLCPSMDQSVRDLVVRATQKDRSNRYQNARQMREDLDALKARWTAPKRQRTPLPEVPAPSAKGPGTPPEAEPASGRASTRRNRTPLPESAAPSPAGQQGTQRTRAAVASRAPEAGPHAAAPAGAICDREQLLALAKRIIIDKERLKATLILAPGACFSRFLLEQLLQATGVCHGIAPPAIHEATRQSTIARRIILASGDPPAPGMTGRDVRGEVIPALELALVIRISDDCMEAVALTRPGQLVAGQEIEQAVKASGLRYGLDVLALRQLCDGPPPADGRLTIARGRTLKPGRPAGFTLCGEVSNTQVERLVDTQHFAQVQPGTLLGLWCEGERGRSGMDVLGRHCPSPVHTQRQPSDCLGDGVELAHDAQGRIAVRAVRAGLCQRQLDGSVRVVGAIEIAGDLGPDQPAIDTADLVVVHCNVLAGTTIRSSSDVVILGNLADASVHSGGHLEVHGAIAAGEQPVDIAGTVQASSIAVRRIMAGNLRITGEVRNCEVIASGDIDIARVIGGSLTAGGRISVAVAGDRDGTTTELWAGHRLDYGTQAAAAKLAERHHEAERDRLVSDRQAIASEITHMQAKQRRLGLSQFVAHNVLESIKGHLLLLEQHHQHVSAAAEGIRLSLAKHREVSSQLTQLGEDAHAGVQVAVVAYAGVVARLANVEPEVLTAPRLKYRLGTTSGAPPGPPAP